MGTSLCKTRLIRTVFEELYTGRREKTASSSLPTRPGESDEEYIRKLNLTLARAISKMGVKDCMFDLG